MKKIGLFLIILLVIVSCKNNKNYTFENNIIPIPSETVLNGGAYQLSDEIGIVFNDNSQEAANIKNYVTGFLSQSFKVSIVEKKEGDFLHIIFSIGTKNEQISPESYELEINDGFVNITASDYAGLFWGFQTLRQIFPVSVEAGKVGTEDYLPYLKIKDTPKFKYRGMHLDVCRHFFSVDEVKEYIDLLVMHKYNTFHWHLTEDQGWRVEIDAFPKLNTIASQRKETVIKKNTGKYDGKPYGGLYSKEDIREVVKYAEERFITVIPEIEMPGHALAALTAYPELGCTGGPYEVATLWGVFDDVFCAGNEKTFEFLEAIIDEVCELFPNSPYIHIGGDECPKVRWEECAKCQKRIKDENLKNEHELQSYFITRMEKYVNSKGRQIIGWDEILEGGLAPNATVMSWQGEKGGIASAQQKHEVIMCPVDACYFNYYQSEDIENEPFTIGGFINTEKVYSWNPIPESLTKDEQKYIIGVQGNVWSEYMHSFDALEYMVLPRMAALSEVAWSEHQRNDYSKFKKRLQSLFKRYELLGNNFAKHELDNTIK